MKDGNFLTCCVSLPLEASLHDSTNAPRWAREEQAALFGYAWLTVVFNKLLLNEQSNWISKFYMQMQLNELSTGILC